MMSGLEVKGRATDCKLCRSLHQFSHSEVKLSFGGPSALNFLGHQHF